MKLTRFNASNTVSLRGGAATIRMAVGGVMSISKIAVAQTGLKHGDKIGFVQDEESPEDWFIVMDKEGFELRKPNDADYLNVNNSAFTKAMLESLGYELSKTKSVVFKINTEQQEVDGEKMWLILTASGQVTAVQED